jgi:hypothetical protein
VTRDSRTDRWLLANLLDVNCRCPETLLSSQTGFSPSRHFSHSFTQRAFHCGKVALSPNVVIALCRFVIFSFCLPLFPISPSSTPLFHTVSSPFFICPQLTPKQLSHLRKRSTCGAQWGLVGLSAAAFLRSEVVFHIRAFQPRSLPVGQEEWRLLGCYSLWLL